MNFEAEMKISSKEEQRGEFRNYSEIFANIAKFSLCTKFRYIAKFSLYSEISLLTKLGYGCSPCEDKTVHSEVSKTKKKLFIFILLLLL